MIQFVLPIFILLAAVGVFFGFTKGQLTTIDGLKSEIAEYQKAVDKSTQLLNRRDELLELKKQMKPEDIERLKILMPDDVNSTKLVLEIQNLAVNVHKMSFENPKYDPAKKVTGDVKIQTTNTDNSKTNTNIPNTPSTQRDLTQGQKDYGTFELEFTVIGSYDSFISFIEDLEKSLRIVDIQQVDISPKDAVLTGPNPSQNTLNLKYVVKIQTYWLKS